MMLASIERCRDAARHLRGFLRNYSRFCDFLGNDLLRAMADVMHDREAENKKELLAVVAEWMSWPDEQLVMRLRGQGQARFLMFGRGVEEMLGALLDDEVCGEIAQALLNLVPGLAGVPRSQVAVA
jgi:hypothetical protein